MLPVMFDQLPATPARIPGARRLYRVAQHRIDQITSSALWESCPQLGLEAAWDVILQLGTDLDRMAMHVDRAVYLQPRGRHL